MVLEGDGEGELDWSTVFVRPRLMVQQWPQIDQLTQDLEMQAGSSDACCINLILSGSDSNVACGLKSQEEGRGRHETQSVRHIATKMYSSDLRSSRGNHTRHTLILHHNNVYNHRDRDPR